MTWEERWHPLREEWVMVAAHRQDRPWSGEAMTGASAALPEYVPECYLCPGNARVSGERNPDYAQTYVFDNDHPCVGAHAPRPPHLPDGPFKNRPANGIARVVCYTPLHNLSLARLRPEQIDILLRTWQLQYRELAAHPDINHVLVFENKGEIVGVSNPHPHGQIYGTNFVFKTIQTEARVGERHLAETGRVLFQDILTAERSDGRRIVYENDTAIVFVPYFGRYAYEVYVAPKSTHASLADLNDAERSDLAVALKSLLVMYDNLWSMSFPYVMVLHQAPTDGEAYAGFHFHIEFHPPLRKPDLLKYLAGPEIGGGNFLSDTSPEEKAAELRSQSSTHFLDQR
jgi:UDPglucose--hexose-1-phosphate uridylyltransferase